MNYPFPRLGKAEKAMPAVAAGSVDPHAYAGRPVEYAREVLKVSPTPDQCQLLEHLHVPPFRVLVPSAHDVGKTFIAAVATNYWHDSFRPGVVLTTAPTKRDVVDLLWTEVRLLRQRAGLPMNFTGPSAPEMRTGPDHFAKGFTASTGETFKGRHRARMLFIFDEGNEVKPAYYTTTKTMFDPDLHHAWLVIFNPTDTTTQAYQEDAACDEADGRPRWHRFRLSALNHPNVLAELKGQPKPIPGAVSRAMVDEWVSDWCEPVATADRVATDIEWPPSAITGKPGKWYRPGPIFQSRAMGLWPDAGDGVWSPALWEACQHGLGQFALGDLPVIGCDCATGKGEDYHAIHARWGTASVHHETANTMEPARIHAAIIEVCRQMADLVNRERGPAYQTVSAQQIPINIDDDGTGNAIGSFLRRDRYTCLQIGAGTKAADEEKYPNRRSELWFQTAAKAKAGLVSTARLGRADRSRLRSQLLAPKWHLDSAGRREVESKDDTKERIGRSPDDADAMNLAYYTPIKGSFEAVEPDHVPSKVMYGRRR